MNFKWTPVMVLSYLKFESCAGLQPAEWHHQLEEDRKAAKALFGYTWDNGQSRFEANGEEFDFQVNADQTSGNGSLAVWQSSGGASVGHYLLAAHDPAQRLHAIRTALNHAERYAQGLYRCTGCQEWKTHPWKGSIYAGRYCEECADAPSYHTQKAVEGI